MKKLISALLAVLLLAAPVLAADEPDTLAARFDALRAEYHLDETNFAVSYYNTVTGEEYNWNETAMFTAASTFKLPLNLYYYELQNEGKISGDTVLTEGGATLDRCHYLSLVESNNELSIAMLYRIGDFRTYKETMRRYFTMTDDEIDPKYYQDNYYCTRMMMDALKYLYAHADEFPEMLDYMEQSLPRDAYFLHDLADEVTIAHKYGSFEGAENDTGIFYTEQPFLLAVYTQSVGERIVALAADLAYDYNLEQTRLQRQAQNQAAADAAWAAAIEAQRARFAADQAASAEAQARIDAEKALAELEEIEAAQKKAALPALEIEPLTEEKVDFDTFCKSDFRAVKVKACEAVKKSDKLLKFTLDDGTGTDRQILSGIHKWYEPEQLIGKTLLAIVNLPPRKMMGQESCGMLISAVHTEHGEEQLHLVMLDDAIPAGAKMC